MCTYISFHGTVFIRWLSTLASIVVAVCTVLSASCGLAQVTGESLLATATTDRATYDLFDTAIQRFRNQDLQGCRAILDEAKANDPSLPPPGVILAQLWLETRQLEPAMKELDNTATQFPDDPEPHIMIGDLTYQERRFTSAESSFLRAKELTDKYQANPARRRYFEIRCNAGLAATAEAKDQWAIAFKHLKAWQALDPRSAPVHSRLGRAMFKLGQEADALAAFRRAKELNSDLEAPEIILAKLYADAGNIEAAMRLGLKAKDRKLTGPDTPQANEILQALSKSKAVWKKYENEASGYSVIAPPEVWENCLEELLSISVRDCPDDFKEVWEAYLLGCKEVCDGLKRKGSPIELAAGAAKAALSGGSSLIEEVEKAGAISKVHSDALLRLRIVAKRYGVE